MQQTNKYKLNLIETSDTFSPNPLNENAQKVEAALSAEANARQSAVTTLSQRITAIDGLPHLVKLRGPVTVPEGETDLVVDLSGIDLTKYRALLLTYITRNAGSSHLYTTGGTSIVSLGAVHGGGIYLMLFSGDGYAYVYGMYTGRNTTGGSVGYDNESERALLREEITGLRAVGFGPGSSMTVYGLIS